MNLGEKIMFSRKKAGMSQIDLADAMGVSRQSVSKWETGEANPDITKLSQLARVLNVSVDWLLSDTAPDDFLETEDREQKSQTVNSYPDWMNHLPKFALNLAKRYGWLFGVYVAIAGAVFLVFGVIVRIMARSFIFGNGKTSIQSGLNTYWYGDLFGGTDPFMEINRKAWTVFSTLTGVTIVVGVVILAAGILIAASLRKWRKRDN